MTTRVANLRDGIPPDGVYIGRAGRGFDGYFGNPYSVADAGSRAAAIERFAVYFARRWDNDAEFRTRVLALKGKTLLCFCKPLACHGDVIAAWLDR